MWDWLIETPSLKNVPNDDPEGKSENFIYVKAETVHSFISTLIKSAIFIYGGDQNKLVLNNI